MNERIRALAKQAEFSARDLHIQNDNFQRFAELIVQECIDCINNTDKGGIFTAQSAGIVGAAHQRSIQTIKEHFGVKE